ncbi:DUF397 domain-containing protein [Nocardiopsis sp. Huas11]|uniref:DUF397 domain-containing protein n=1 Tax=Nocardiopsis sp. Huas11 TaxID=2183912 RepID=UPI0035195844
MSCCVEGSRMNDWHKSSYSPNGSNCVEVAEGVTTAVRDTQNRELGQLDFASGEWAALVGSLRAHG